MLIGVDFDNTIVCYDELFWKMALEQKLVPASVPPAKGAVRDFLRQAGEEDAWTQLQGRVYGERMQEATAFPGVLDFFRLCRRQRVPLYIISHRTLGPARGEDFDLHAAARTWLTTHGFHNPRGIGLDSGHVFFEVTQDDKLARVSQVGCTHFVDDLPEFFAKPAFPKGIERILFDPNALHADFTLGRRVDSWIALTKLLLTP